MQKLTKIGMKISGKEYYGVSNPRWKFLGPIVDNMWEQQLERLSACDLQWNGGGLLVWGCISDSGVGNIVWIDGIMNAEKCRQVLIHHAILSGKRLIGNGFIFQPDKNPKHTANAVKYSTESRPEYYRGIMGSPGQRKK